MILTPDPIDADRADDALAAIDGCTWEARRALDHTPAPDLERYAAAVAGIREHLVALDTSASRPGEEQAPARYQIEQPDPETLITCFGPYRVTITTGADRVPLLCLDGPSDRLRIRLNDVPIWASPPGPGDPRLHELARDPTPLPHAQQLLKELQAALTDLITRTDAVIQVWEAGDLAQAVNALRSAATRHVRQFEIRWEEHHARTE